LDALASAHGADRRASRAGVPQHDRANRCAYRSVTSHYLANNGETGADRIAARGDASQAETAAAVRKQGVERAAAGAAVAHANHVRCVR
jgi:hypothetical protein